MERNQYRDKVIVKKRMLVVFFVLLVLFSALIVRLGYVMIVKGKEYKTKAIQQWTSDVRIAAKRGRILDTNEKELAISGNVYRVDLYLKDVRETVKDPKNTKDLANDKKIEMRELTSSIAEILEMDKNKVYDVFVKPLPNGKPKGSAILKRRIEKDKADAITAFCDKRGIKGVIISPDTKRYYPNNNFLAHVLGHTNSDGEGLTGAELYYNQYLAGVPGLKIAESNIMREELPYTISDFAKPIPGKDVILTIDEMIQHFCEKAADQALNDRKAKAVTIIAMNPKNGEILGLVNKPDYNLNDPWMKDKTSDELQKLWRNRAVSDTFEPGSIFKVVTSTAALEEKTFNKDHKFQCNGVKMVAGKPRHCANHKAHGTQSFVDILKNSCNIGFIEVGENLGAEKLSKYIQGFGFGKKTGIDLNGEASGIIVKAKNMSVADLASISFGQTNTLTCMQYMAAFNAIANGGDVITPHIMKEIVSFNEDNKKEIVKTFDINSTKRKVASEGTMKELRSYLEQVVESGGGNKAYIPGYHIAGKTGTAQKIAKGGGYDQGKYIASFAGMAPSNDPKLTVLVSIDEPEGMPYYGGVIAAPVAQQVFNDVFNYWSFKADATGEEIAKSLLKDVVIPEIRGLEKTEVPKVLKENHLKYKIEGEGKYITDINPKPGYTVKEGTSITLYTGNTPGHDDLVIVPNLKGMSVEKAAKLLSSLGLKLDFSGEGAIASQSIEAGQVVSKGRMINLRLELIAD